MGNNFLGPTKTTIQLEYFKNLQLKYWHLSQIDWPQDRRVRADLCLSV